MSVFVWELILLIIWYRVSIQRSKLRSANFLTSIFLCFTFGFLFNWQGAASTVIYVEFLCIIWVPVTSVQDIRSDLNRYVSESSIVTSVRMRTRYKRASVGDGAEIRRAEIKLPPGAEAVITNCGSCSLLRLQHWLRLLSIYQKTWRNFILKNHGCWRSFCKMLQNQLTQLFHRNERDVSVLLTYKSTRYLL